MPKPDDYRGMGWRKAAEMVKVAQRERKDLDSAPWVHKAQLPEKSLSAKSRST